MKTFYLLTLRKANLPKSLKNKLSLESNQDIVKKVVESALQMKSNDLIFATEREKCVGGCFGATPCFEMELEESDYQELKSVFEKYDFEKYFSVIIFR